MAEEANTMKTDELHLLFISAPAKPTNVVEIPTYRRDKESAFERKTKSVLIRTRL